jgi:hypothetical protein
MVFLPKAPFLNGKPMTAIANIVAFDGASTPVSHTFVAGAVTRESDGSVVANWKEANVSVPDAAQGRVTMSMLKQKSGVYRVISKVEIPVMEAIAGNNSSGYTAAPKVAYVDTVVTTGYFSERDTPAGRRLVRQLSTNIMNGVATSVTPVTTGPVAELFDLLTMPS